MASTGSKVKPKLSFAISYGLGGGPLHARKLSRLLNARGLKLAAKPETADIIIAHSGGCWLIPASANPKLVIYIGLPLAVDNPRRTLLAARADMLKRSPLSWTLKTMLKNAYYTASRPRHNWRLARMAKTAQPVIFPDSAAVFITNRYDPWPRDKQQKDYVSNRNWAFISLPGSHDDIWEHPERYASIINHYARLLA